MKYKISDRDKTLKLGYQFFQSFRNTSIGKTML